MSFLVQQQQLDLKKIPAPIQIVSYDPAFYSPKLFIEQLEIVPPESLSQWAEKRQAQFLAGRIAANNALYHLGGIETQSISIGDHREPIWPKGIIGSISHSENSSIATALSKSNNDKGAGLDMQAIFKNDDKVNLLNIILSKQDWVIFKKMEDSFPECYLATLIFSAKESFFKAVFSEVNQYFDFNDVSIHSFDLSNNQLIVVSNKNSLILPEIMLIIHYEFTQINITKMNVITYCLNKI